MYSGTNQTKSLSIALLLLGLLAGTLAGTAAAETMTFTAPKYDNCGTFCVGVYAPGETFTVTIGGMSTSTSYDLVIRWKNSTGDKVWIELNMTPTTVDITRAITIPDNWNGTYTFYAYRNATQTTAASRSFTVRLFTLEAEADHAVYLAGQRVTVFYFTQRTMDQKPLTDGHGTWRITVQRDNGTGFVSEPMGASITATSGSFSFELPTTTRTTSYSLTVVFNNSNDEHSQSTSLIIDVGVFNVFAYNDRSVYAPGDSVVVTVYAGANGNYGSEDVQGAEVSMKIEKFDTGTSTWNVEESYGTRTGATDVQGSISFLVPLPTSVADDTRLRARATATKAGAPQEASAEFGVHTPTGFSITLKLDKDLYKPGETVHARLVFTTTNASLISGSMYAWSIRDGNNDRVFVSELVAGVSTGSNRDFAIPSDFTGELDFQVTVYTPDQNTYSESETVDVFSYSLLINPSKQYFMPGDVITVSVALVTDRVASASFYWTVSANTGGDPLAKGSIPTGAKTGSFQFTIPTSEPADYYIIQVAAEGSGLVARDTSYVYRAEYVALQLPIPDQQYKPGDTVPIRYAFVVVGNATPPATTTISVSLSGLAGSSRSFEVDTSSGMSGTLQYVIPASAPNTGDMTLMASSSGAGTSTTTLFVRPSTGGSPVSQAAGMASAGLVLAILGILIGVGAIFMVRKMSGGGSSGGRMGGSRPSSGFKVGEDDAPKPKDRSMMDNTNVIGQPIKDEKREPFNEPPKSL